MYNVFFSMKIYKELGMAETALSPGNLRTYNRNDILDTYRNGSLSFAGNAGNFFNQNTQSDSVTRNNVNNTPLNSRKGPKYPQYSITCIRLSTFQAWPSSIQQHPETMAEAGFYYTGKSIQVYLSNVCNDFPPCGSSIGNKHILSYCNDFFPCGPSIGNKHTCILFSSLCILY
jgi:hypothetical protein